MDKPFYQLVLETKDIEDLLRETNGEVTPEVQELLVAGTEVALINKVDAIGAKEHSLKLKAEYYKKIKERAARMERGINNSIGHIRSYAKNGMGVLDIDELIGSQYRFKISRCKTSLEIEDDKIPDSYKMTVTETVPDKERLRKDLEAGKEIPGAQLTGGVSIRIEEAD